jgi:hypothetical protein
MTATVLLPLEMSMPTEFICIPPICESQPESIFFLIADSIYWVTRTRWLNLLKSNAAIRGWLTVFRSDMEAQGGIGQPVAPLIVA